MSELEFLDGLERDLAAAAGPRTFLKPGLPLGLEEVAYPTLHDWKLEVLSLTLPSRAPHIVSAKFRRAQTLYFLAWLDPDLIKSAEMVAFSTLELALNDQYGAAPTFRNGKAKIFNSMGQMKTPSFAALLRYMVDQDGLTDTDLPSVTRVNGSAIGFLLGTSQPTLAERRNGLAHGNPFDGWPSVGLFEMIAELIAYAYRDRSPEGLP